MENTEINLELRSEILEYSLILEKSINDLLLFQLGIFDGGISTKLFGKKQGRITFQNKIDLLLDIEILNKEENLELQLLMAFRNKFLHDIECNSMQNLINQLDNSLKNRFKLFLKEGHKITDENNCRSACSELFLKNIRTIRKKFEQRRNKIEEKNEIFQLLNNHIIFQNDVFFDLIQEILLTLEKSELEDEKVRKLCTSISQICEANSKKIQNDSKAISFRDKLDSFLDTEKLNNYFGVSKINNTNF